MTSKTHYPPIIGDGEDTTPVKKTYGVDDNYDSTDITPEQAGKGLFQWQDTEDIVYSNGTRFISLAPKKLINFGERVLVPSLAAANAATYSQSGNIITVDNGVAHNIPATTYDGIMVYLAIGAVSTGVAPTADFANFFTNFQRTGANTFTCEATNSQTGTGAVNTNISATSILPALKTIPAGTIAKGDTLSYIWAITCNNSAGAKTIRQILGVTQILALQVTTATGSSGASINLMIALDTDRQFISYGNAIVAVNLLADLSLYSTLQCAAVNDFVCLEYILIERNRS